MKKSGNRCRTDSSYQPSVHSRELSDQPSEDSTSESSSSDQSSEDSSEDVVFESPITAKDGVYHCMACNKNMSGHIPLQAHEQSIKHCQLVEQWREPPIDPADDGIPRRDSRFCSICKVPFSGPISAEQHYNSKRHKNKQGMYPSSINRGISEEETILIGGCLPCRVLCFTSINHYETHVAGQAHRKLCHISIPAPVRELPPLELILPSDIDVDKLTFTNPRHYQKELFNQAMQRRNAVIFLPTGTGKTLVAAMVIQAMLMMNPKRQVVFLVDKILLCIQQTDYLGKELTAFFRRGKLPRIMGLSGGGHFSAMDSEAEDHVSQYNVLVITAEYFRNMLKRRTLRWENISLLVFDETHHCNKDHPYNMIMREHYTELNHKPKIVGFSATPAGRSTSESTASGLNNLLANLGDAELAYVVERREELYEYKTKSKLKIKTIELDPQLNYLLEILKSDAESLFRRLLRKTKLGELLQDRHVDEDVLNSGAVVDVCGALSELSDEELSHSLTLLVNYMSLLITAISHLRTRECRCDIEYFVAKIDRPVHAASYSCKYLTDTSLTEEDLKRLVRSLESGDKISRLIVEGIIKQLRGRFDDEQNTIRDDEPLALVMVKTRLAAEELTRKLNRHQFFIKQRITAMKLVGHGSRTRKDGKTCTPGMSVSEQRKALRDIKEKMYQVVVATSVAEEGVDIPECDLVIVLYVPATTTAFVQLRGRARRKRSRMIILQSDVTRRDTDKLLENESRMEEAIYEAFKQQAKQREQQQLMRTKIRKKHGK